jgi:hypothetical protein
LWAKLAREEGTGKTRRGKEKLLRPELWRKNMRLSHGRKIAG